MYKIPSNINFIQLEGKNLNLISFSTNQIFLQFELEFEIIIEGDFIIGNIDFDKNERHSVFPVKTDFGLLDFLECTTKKFIIEHEDQNLRIEFSNDQYIILIGDKHYESFKLKIMNRTFII